MTDQTPPSALLLLQASERLISAWDHPTMDGGALAKAKREFREAFAAAATEHRLAAQNAPLPPQVHVEGEMCDCARCLTGGS